MDKATKTEIPYLEVLKRRTLKKWMASLESSGNEEHNHIVEELKIAETSILSLDGSYGAVDRFISDNLALIDSVNSHNMAQQYPPLPPPGPQQTYRRTASQRKSPLSQVVTAEMSEESSENTLQELDITS